MNLIEQLGGYEKLKPHFLLTDRTIGYTHIYLHGNNHYCFLDESVDYIIPDRAIPIKDVFDALLEYRRQHNIFEVGDSIMYESKLYEIKYIYHPEKARITDGFQGRTVYDFPRGIRHATPEEIEAGKRL